MTAPLVRLGFVGVGNMGQAAHLRNFQMVPNCTVVAIADIRRAHATAVAHKWGVPHVYDTHEAMLAAHPEIDALVAIQTTNANIVALTCWPCPDIRPHGLLWLDTIL